MSIQINQNSKHSNASTPINLIFIKIKFIFNEVTYTQRLTECTFYSPFICIHHFKVRSDAARDKLNVKIRDYMKIDFPFLEINLNGRFVI